MDLNFIFSKLFDTCAKFLLNSINPYLPEVRKEGIPPAVIGPYEYPGISRVNDTANSAWYKRNFSVVFPSV